MMVITASAITEELAEENELECASVDYASIYAAEQAEADTFEGCTQLPVYAVAFKQAEDMVIPTFLCSLHFNALKISLHEGIGVDEDVFGKFPKEED